MLRKILFSSFCRLIVCTLCIEYYSEFTLLHLWMPTILWKILLLYKMLFIVIKIEDSNILRLNDHDLRIQNMKLLCTTWTFEVLFQIQKKGMEIWSQLSNQKRNKKIFNCHIQIRNTAFLSFNNFVSIRVFRKLYGVCFVDDENWSIARVD